jgi:hypothetical protein
MTCKFCSRFSVGVFAFGNVYILKISLQKNESQKNLQMKKPAFLVGVEM